MSRFAYRLVVLSHGDSHTLPEAVGAFIAHADPLPRETVIVVDGPAGAAVSDVEAVLDRARLTVRVEPDTAQRGFCEATARAWTYAASPRFDHAFYLEGDFKLTRELDVQAMADVLDRDEELAQMVLLRQAVNEQEVAAGGLREARPGQFTERALLGHRYTVQDQFLSTNPFLASTAFMRAHPWPSYDQNCEGLFGADLRDEGWKFGMWGGLDDGPWCEHVGVRDGYGY